MSIVRDSGDHNFNMTQQSHLFVGTELLAVWVAFLTGESAV